MPWPQAQTIETPRLRLGPLSPEHADELAPLLDDQRLHEFTGGRPLSLTELRARYVRLSVGQSADEEQGWLNWIVRERKSGQPVGTVQATLFTSEQAAIAWVIGSSNQGRGYAKEAARAMADWLRAHGVVRMQANIHPRNRASSAVAAGVGLSPTDELVDGEVVWRWTKR